MARQITISDDDIARLGGTLPRGGFLQVWRLTAQGQQLDATRTIEVALRANSVELGETEEGSAYRLAPRGARGLGGSWVVTVPAGDPISLADLVTAHSVDPGTLTPTNPTPTLLQTIRQVVVDEARDRF